MSNLFIKMVEWEEVINDLNIPEGFDNEGFKLGFLVFKNKKRLYPDQLFWFKSDKSRWKGLEDYLAK
tara:strand:- start:7673 stop:7873 length:201 start_codon:yes stop_codon:yes gene_type:complete